MKFFLGPHLESRKGCRGEFTLEPFLRNAVCVWSLPDLVSILKEKKNYVINKFRSDFDPFIIECIRDNIKQRETLE